MSEAAAGRRYRNHEGIDAMFQKLVVCVMLMPFFVSAARAQTRDEMVREDRRKVTEDGFWIYNDLDKAFQQASKSGKPVLVVLRCIPCHECVKLDDDLVDKDPVIRPLLDQFVCVRQVSTNGLDLQTFQYDTDQSFAVFMLNADRTIYGRFGTRSHRTEWLGDVSLEGLAKALQGALDLHQDYPSNKASLAGKRGGSPEVSSPEQFPALREKFTDTLNYEGDVAKSCIHCHQIGEAQREFYWSANKPIPEKVLFPYPHPKSLGLILDPQQRATVKGIEDGSVAQRSGLRPGDRIVSVGGQPPLSIADIQWVLHQTDADGGDLPMVVNRGDKSVSLTLELEKGWRRAGDLSWRATTWALRRMVTGGMLLEELDADERKKLAVSDGSMALRAKHVGQYGPHGTAKRAGAQKGDVLVEFDGRRDLQSEQALISYAINNKQPGDMISVSVLRGRKEVTLQFPIQP
jgi:serine protease Do